MIEEFFRTCLFFDLSLIHEEDSGSHLPGESHLVGDHHHGHAFFGQLFHQFQYFAYHLRIQRGRGLIKEDHVRIHVTEKPLQLMKDVIQICEPGGLILDPFAGAGTTVLAAVMTGYRAVGIEVTDVYYKLGSDRVRIALEAEQKEDEK